MHYLSTLLVSLAGLAAATTPPGYSGYSLIWSDGFGGAGGSLPNSGNWNYITGNLGVNNELQTYTSNSRNLQLSGGSTLQIVPWRDSSVSGGWTSGRVESKYTFTPAAGRRTLVEAQIRFGTNSINNKQGLWPAFWMLGNSIRTGTGWPACGEVDILEQVNGILTGHGTVHCDTYPGGICNEGTGITSSISIPDQGWHTWRVIIDRTPSAWQSESITWYRDGVQFHQVTGGRINNLNVWSTLARSPLFFIINMAVGGDWPGSPNSATLDGYGSFIETAYVAQYQSTSSFAAAGLTNRTVAHTSFNPPIPRY